MLECNVCRVEFDIDTEGGISGCIGTFIEANFCPTCYTGICEMLDLCGPDWCSYVDDEDRPTWQKEILGIADQQDEDQPKDWQQNPDRTFPELRESEPRYDN